MFNKIDAHNSLSRNKQKQILDRTLGYFNGREIIDIRSLQYANCKSNP